MVGIVFVECKIVIDINLCGTADLLFKAPNVLLSIYVACVYVENKKKHPFNRGADIPFKLHSYYTCAIRTLHSVNVHKENRMFYKSFISFDSEL